VGLIAAGIAILSLLWLVPRAQITYLPGASTLAADRKQELEDKARATLAQVIGGTFLLATGYFTWLGLHNQADAQQKQLGISTRGQMTDRFTKAIEQLGAQSRDGTSDLTRRLGGVYALESIARESPEDLRQS